ncbi:MAG: hypothetical protein ABIT01_12925 [Thermoanaerobaculia bacterium]
MRPFRFATLALLITARLAIGQGLLTNGNLDVDLSSWTHDTGLTTWSSQDEGADPRSGSALVRNPVTFAGGSEALRQCVVVTPGRAYGGAARFKTEPGAAPGSAFLLAIFHSAPSCGGDPLGFASSSKRSELSAWASLSIEGIVLPPLTVSVSFSAVNVKDVATGERTTRFDSLAFFAEDRQVLTIPATASVHGRNDSFFQTDLWLVNGSARELPVELRLRCSLAASCRRDPVRLTLSPRASHRIADVVGTLLSSPESSGAVEVFWDAAIGRLEAAARVYTPPLPAPTYGAVVPALRSSESRSRAILIALASSGGDSTSGFRTNVGAYNPGGAAGSVTFTLFASNGSPLGTAVTRELGAQEPVQVNDIFAAADAGSTLTQEAYAVVTATTPVFSYATVVDNRSGDSIVLTGSASEP